MPDRRIRRMIGGPILQIGFGAFGPTHLRAWQALGMAHRLIVADPDRDARARAAVLAPQCRQIADYRQALPECAAVDILTPTDTHHAIACDALAAGKPLCIEKPETSRGSRRAVKGQSRSSQDLD